MPMRWDGRELALSWALRLVVAALVAITTWTVNRQVTLIDELAKESRQTTETVLKMKGQITVLSTQMTNADQHQTQEINTLKGRVDDHENRLRFLEHPIQNGPAKP